MGCDFCTRLAEIRHSHALTWQKDEHWRQVDELLAMIDQLSCEAGAAYQLQGECDYLAAELDRLDPDWTLRCAG